MLNRQEPTSSLVGRDLFGPTEPLPRRTFMPMVVLVLGFASIGVLIVSSHLGDREIRQHDLLERSVDRLELHLAHSHLWLEEYLTGDQEVDLERDVWGHLDEGRDGLRAIRFGGPIGTDRLDPLEDPVLARLAEGLEDHLEDFRDLSHERFGAGAGVGSTRDQAYDVSFRELLDEAQAFRLEVDRRLEEVRGRTELFQRMVIGVWTAIVLAAVLGLYTRERRHREAVELVGRSREWLAATLSSIGDGVATTDLEGRLTYLNPVAEDMIGQSRIEATGIPVGKVVRLLLEGEPIEKPVESILAGGGRLVSEQPRALMTRDGSSIPVDVGASPIQGDEGELRGAVLVFRDASRRLQAEADLHRREMELRRSQKLEAVGRLAGGIAHDVSNYLGAIRGYCEVAMMKGESGPELEKRMTSAIDTCHRVSALIRQLLAFSRRQPVQPEVVDLGRLVGDLEALMKRLLGEDLTAETLSEPGPHHILIDPAQAEQALINLLVNARDAMPNGGRLTIRLGSVELAEGHPDLPADVEPGHFVELSVSDSGCGIPTELHGQIFEPFFTTKEGDHSGLGLATVYGVARQNGGFLSLESELGEGSTFRLFFPATDAEPSIATRPASAVASREGRHILLVEDNEAMRESTRDLLEVLSYEVSVAESAEKALERFEAGQSFDLVITDVVMPGLSGKDLADRLHEQDDPPPVLFISGYTDRVTLRHDGEGERPVHFLEKPFGAADLAAKIRSVLDVSEG